MQIKKTAGESGKKLILEKNPDEDIIHIVPLQQEEKDKGQNQG